MDSNIFAFVVLGLLAVAVPGGLLAASWVLNKHQNKTPLVLTKKRMVVKKKNRH